MEAAILRAAALGMLMLAAWGVSPVFAEPPSHDPSRVIRNTDGRYWIFTTGDGVWAMSSSNAAFTDWRAENTVFPVGTWPSWINQYVTGFNGFFWAPDVVKIGSTYYCYYSCAGQGAPAAIGLATATNLAGPWTDRGRIVNANNAIDPAILQDGANMYMSYGNWQSGIDLIQLSTSTGLRQGTSRWPLIPNQQVEGPYIIKNGSFYYLFFQRGLCCNGCSSTYYIQVGRSSSVTGPYVDRNGVNLTSGGGTTFLPNANGRIRGPGHIGFGEGRLTYHFYNADASCAAQLINGTLSWDAAGWPMTTGTPPAGGSIADGTYRLRNRATGRYLDNLGSSVDGANVVQWSSSSSNNQRWAVTTTGGFRKLRVLSTSKYLDGMGRTTDGSSLGQWANSTSNNQQWTIQQVTGNFYRLVNRATGKAVDTGGLNSDGAVMQQWFSNTSNNQQWEFVAP